MLFYISMCYAAPVWHYHELISILFAIYLVCYALLQFLFISYFAYSVEAFVWCALLFLNFQANVSGLVSVILCPVDMVHASCGLMCTKICSLIRALPCQSHVQSTVHWSCLFSTHPHDRMIPCTLYVYIYIYILYVYT